MGNRIVGLLRRGAIVFLIVSMTWLQIQGQNVTRPRFEAASVKPAVKYSPKVYGHSVKTIVGSDVVEKDVVTRE